MANRVGQFIGKNLLVSGQYIYIIAPRKIQYWLILLAWNMSTLKKATEINTCLLVCLMVLNATFNNILVIPWRSVLLVEETGGLGENHRLYHIMLYTSPWSRFVLNSDKYLINILKACAWCYEWLLFNAKWAVVWREQAIFDEMMMMSTSYIVVVYFYCTIALENSPQVDMSPHSDIWAWLRANQAFAITP